MASSQHPTGRKLSTSGDSLYILLNLPKTATQEEIKKAYRKKALSCHPDKNQGNEEATELFKQINQANAVLTDPTKKKIYDSYGSMGLNLASQIGEERFSSMLCMQKPWAKVLCCFAFIFSGCCCCFCFCFCCNCCCGKCGPTTDDEYSAMPDEDSDAPPVLTEPIEVEPSPSNDQLREADPNVPIAPGPPSGQHTTYGTIAD